MTEAEEKSLSTQVLRSGAIRLYLRTMLLHAVVSLSLCPNLDFCRGQVERDTFCQEVLRSRIEDGVLDPGEIHGDIKTFVPSGAALAAEALIGGWPCQALTSCLQDD